MGLILDNHYLSYGIILHHEILSQSLLMTDSMIHDTMIIIQ